MSWTHALDPATHLVSLARRTARHGAGLRRRTLRLGDGRRVSLLDAEARTEAPVVLMVHGIGARNDNWVPLATRLRGRVRIVAPDLPGFGQSDRAADGDYSMTAQADAVLAVAEALGLRRFHLAGSSMGGRVAAELAARHPSRIETLWLLDPAGAEGDEPGEMIEGVFAGRGLPIFSRTPDEVDAAFTFAMSRPPRIPRMAMRPLAREGAWAYDLNRRIFADMSVEFARAPTTEALLAGLPVPTLISWGAEDRVLHVSGARTIAEAMPNATVRVMPGVGHLPMIEAPDEAAADYLAFLASAGAL